MRHYFKETKKTKKDKLFKFAEENGADYIEDDLAIWKKSTKHRGHNRAAVALNDRGSVLFGHIDEDCDNFVRDENANINETQIWLIKILNITKNFKP